MDGKFYRNIIHQLKTAYAYYKIICSNEGIPVDCEFIEVNAEFESITGLSGADIVGKLISKVLPGIKTDKFDWISFYGDVALTRNSREFEQYSETLNKYFRVKAFSPRKFYFITLMDELPMDRKSLDSIIADESYIFKSSRNVTDRKQMEEELVASEIRYRRLFESAKDGILILEADTG